MNVKLIGRYLIGDREAIRALAADPKAMWLGLLCVLGAGFAREYDAEYLLAEPWHLLVPFGASLASATLLHVVLGITLCLRRRGHPGAIALYRSFVGLFWLTAPLAWLYAIPYERFLSDVGAVKANLLTLGLVAAWRVILMIRVVQVLYGVNVAQAMFPVLLFADGLLMFAMLQLDPRILAFMGGVRLSPAEEIVRSVSVSFFILGYMSLWLWLIGTTVVWIQHLVKTGAFPSPPPQPSPDEDRGPWIVAGAVVVIGVCLLPLTQAAQSRRYAVEQALAKDEFDRVVELLCTQPQDMFPARWDPPPRRHGSDLLEVCERLVAREDAPEWVVESYSAEVAELAGVGRFRPLNPDDEEHAERVLRLLVVWPDLGGISQARAGIASVLENQRQRVARAEKERSAPPVLANQALWEQALQRLDGAKR